MSSSSSSSIINRITPEKVMALGDNEIFVFGSNRSGRHGRGAAKVALNKFGAIWKQADGLQGKSYAIPTKGRSMEILSISEIEHYIRKFIIFAKRHPELTFLTTPIGCGLARYSPREIAPLFKDAINIQNIYLPMVFWNILKK
jgi:hypothetical protein